jgi:hypothetical protein
MADRQAVYGLFRRWQRDGTWAQVLTRLQAAADGQGRIRWQVSVDSTVCRAHHTPLFAAGQPQAPPQLHTALHQIEQLIDTQLAEARLPARWSTVALDWHTLAVLRGPHPRYSALLSTSR